MKFRFFCLKTQCIAMISTKTKHFSESEITVSRAHQKHAFSGLFRDLSRAVRPKWWFPIFWKSEIALSRVHQNTSFSRICNYLKKACFFISLEEITLPVRFLKMWKCWISWKFESDPGNSEDFKLALNLEIICWGC